MKERPVNICPICWEESGGKTDNKVVLMQDVVAIVSYQWIVKDDLSIDDGSDIYNIEPIPEKLEERYYKCESNWKHNFKVNEDKSIGEPTETAFD